MKVYRVYVVEDLGYNGIIEKEIGCFSNPDDTDKCVDLCDQMIVNGRSRYDYVHCDTYEIDDLETAMKRLEGMCEKEENQDE